MTTTMLTATATRTLPRVNLLPPEIGERQRFRRVQVGLGAAVVAAFAVVGLLYVSAAADVGSAQDELAVAQKQTTSLERQATQYTEVPVVYEQVARARQQLAAAMGPEVRWSYYLNDLSLTIPSQVWLTGMSVAQSVDPAVGGGAQGAPAGGRIEFTGKAYSHNDVAAWLQSLAKQKGYANPYLTTSKLTETADGARQTVEFTSSVTLTDAALSRRFTTKAGG